MIISHKHKFIFIKTPKTAGTSLEIALSEYCGNEDIITPISPRDERVRVEKGFKSARNYYLSFSKYKKIDFARLVLQGKRAAFYNHMGAEEISKLVDPEIWSGYYKFCFERNPWDKFISWYAWNNRNNEFHSMNEFIEKGMATKIKGFDLYTIGGVLAVDDVFKYEEMESSLEKISEKIGLDKKIKMPDFVAKGNFRKDKKHYSEVLDERASNLIDVFAAREIKLLGYKKAGPK